MCSFLNHVQQKHNVQLTLAKGSLMVGITKTNVWGALLEPNGNKWC